MAEQFANDARSTLFGAIDESTTTLTVFDSSEFPATGTFRILVDSELMEVTNVSGDVFTVTRGSENTTAALHSDSAPVAHVLTSGALAQLKTDIASAGSVTSSEGTTASRPAAGSTGNLYLGENYLARDDGTVWVDYGPVAKMQVPTGSFSWINQSNSQLTIGPAGELFFDCDPQGTGLLESYVTAAPSAPYTVTAGVTMQLGVGDGRAGVCVRDSATGELEVFWVTHDPLVLAALHLTTDDGTGSTSTVLSKSIMLPNALLYLRIENDGTTFRYSISANNATYIEFATRSVGTNAADQIGLVMNNLGHTLWGQPGSQLNVYYWDVS